MQEIQKEQQSLSQNSVSEFKNPNQIGLFTFYKEGKDLSKCLIDWDRQNIQKKQKKQKTEKYQSEKHLKKKYKEKLHNTIHQLSYNKILPQVKIKSKRVEEKQSIRPEIITLNYYVMEQDKIKKKKNRTIISKGRKVTCDNERISISMSKQGRMKTERKYINQFEKSFDEIKRQRNEMIRFQRRRQEKKKKNLQNRVLEELQKKKKKKTVNIKENSIVKSGKSIQCLSNKYNLPFLNTQKGETMPIKRSMHKSNRQEYQFGRPFCENTFYVF